MFFLTKNAVTNSFRGGHFASKSTKYRFMLVSKYIREYGGCRQIFIQKNYLTLFNRAVRDLESTATISNIRWPSFDWLNTKKDKTNKQ